jgi:hypothetical protein
MTQDEAIETALIHLDMMPHEVNRWEATFLESVLMYGVHTPKQRVALAKLADKYLPEKLLGAEILGQERLL